MAARSRKKRKQILIDTFFVVCSIAAAGAIVESGIVHTLGESFKDLGYVGSFFAGMLFTSVFTTVPAIAVLAELSQNTSVIVVALLGGLGAVVGDYIIFRFVRDRVAGDVKYLLSHSKFVRFPKIFKTRLSRWLVPLVGALVIASPLPDELGLAILGAYRMRDRTFLPLSFIFNASGILAIGLLANSVL